MTLRLVALALLSITMMSLDQRQHHLDSIRALLSVVIYPLQRLIDLPRESGEWFSESLSSRQSLLQENSRLHARQLLLRSRLQKMAGLQAENSRLRKLLKSSSKVAERVLIAELLAVDMAPFSRQVILNKGRRDGVYTGQPVLDASGVLGQVVFAGPLSSNVILITDPSHALPVSVNRNGLRAVAIGTDKTDQLELSHLPNNADIREGDLLLTSGLGGRFPPGYPVATITHIERDRNLPFATVFAKPTGHLESSREVLIVWTQPQTTDPEKAKTTAPTPAVKAEQ